MKKLFLTLISGVLLMGYTTEAEQRSKASGRPKSYVLSNPKLNSGFKESDIEVERTGLGPNQQEVVITKTLTNSTGEVKQESSEYIRVQPGLNKMDPNTGQWESTVIQVITEFTHNTPEEKTVNRFQKPVSGSSPLFFEDHGLQFGKFTMGLGEAFGMSDGKRGHQDAAVTKRWVETNQRSLLIESVFYEQYVALANEAELAPASQEVLSAGVEDSSQFPEPPEINRVE